MIESYIIIFAIGIVVGFINIAAAGGSLISLPLLIFFGVPSTMANGTNRIAIFVQNLSALYVFYKQKVFEWKLCLKLSLPTIVGAILGSMYAIELPDEAFDKILAIVTMVVLILILFKPHQKVKRKEVEINTKRMILLMIAFFFIGFYGGFIQAGVGFLIIASLTLLAGNMSLAQMHSVKTIIITIYLIFSIALFVSSDNIDWGFAVALSLGSLIGGGLGSRFALNISEKYLKIFMIVVIGGLSLYLLFRS